jgi:hypothetical protein
MFTMPFFEISVKTEFLWFDGLLDRKTAVIFSPIISLVLCSRNTAVFCGVDEYMQYEQQSAASGMETVQGKGAGTCFGSGPELGFETSQKPAVGTTVVTPKLVPPNTNAEGSTIKGSEDEDPKERACMVNASEDEDKKLNG